MDDKLNHLKKLLSESKSQVTKNREVTSVTTDKLLPLEDRWNLYVEAVNSGYLFNEDLSYFIPPELEKENFCLYNNMGVEKYQTYYYENFTYYLIDAEISSEKVNTVKEQILQTGKSGWINDW